MTLTEAAQRLRAAEIELRNAQDKHDGSSFSAARYQAAVAELLPAEAVGRSYLREMTVDKESYKYRLRCV